MTRLSTISSFKINKYILLKLKNDNKTYIYVNGKKFRQCSYLLFIIDDLYKVKDFKSIDEVSDELISKENKIKINPLDEFWGHCSNLQAWAENNYDTRLLHSNLAFPLLKTLSDEGDKKAEKVFKEEFPKAKVQRCQVHVARNVLANVPKKLKKAVADEMRSIFYASSKPKATEFFNGFQNRWEKEIPSAVKCLDNSIESCLTFFICPEEE